MRREIVLSRRELCRAMMLMPVVSALSGCSSSNPPLLIGHNSYLPYRLMQLAQQQINDESVRMVLHESATMVAQAIASGSLHGGLLTLDEVMRLWSQGIDLQIVAIIDVSVGVDQLLVHPSITELSQLRGKKIAVETGAVGSVMLYKLLQHAGLNESDVKLVYSDVAHHIEQYKSREIDAAISFSPVSLQLVQMGAITLFSSAQFEPVIVDVLAVKRNALIHYAEHVSRLRTTYFELVTQWSKNDELVLNRLSIVAGLDRTHLVESFNGVQMMGAEQNALWLSAGDTHLDNAVAQLADILLLPRTNVAEKIWRDQARESGG